MKPLGLMIKAAFILTLVGYPWYVQHVESQPTPELAPEY